MFFAILSPISPLIKLSISLSQAQGDIGFLWADTGDDMAKTMSYYINLLLLKSMTSMTNFIKNGQNDLLENI